MWEVVKVDISAVRIFLECAGHSRANRGSSEERGNTVCLQTDLHHQQMPTYPCDSPLTLLWCANRPAFV